MAKYNTTTKKIVINEIENMKNNFTISELKSKLDNEKKEVGLTTIYRIIDELVEQGTIKKYYNDSNISNYQYIKKCEHNNHFNLKCLNCGKITHIDCDCVNEFSNHILKKHGFNLEDNNMFITGLCKECKK